MTKNELSHERVIALGILVFLMNFIPPMIKITAHDYPSPLECINFALVGLLQVVVIYYSLLQRKEKKDEEKPKEPNDAKD